MADFALGPTGFGDSPYQCFSALAGNPLLISLNGLSSGVPAAPGFCRDRVDFERVIPWKMAALETAADEFREGAAVAQRRRFEEFCDENADWLDDFAFFMALKEHNPVMWTHWDEVRVRDTAALKGWRELLDESVATQEVLQFEFFHSGAI